MYLPQDWLHHAANNYVNIEIHNVVIMFHISLCKHCTNHLAVGIYLHTRHSFFIAFRTDRCKLI